MKRAPMLFQTHKTVACVLHVSILALVVLVWPNSSDVININSIYTNQIVGPFTIITCVRRSIISSRDKTMVVSLWFAGLSRIAKTEIHFLQEKLNAEMYCKTLPDHMILFAYSLQNENFIFQQNGQQFVQPISLWSSVRRRIWILFRG